MQKCAVAKRHSKRKLGCLNKLLVCFYCTSAPSQPTESTDSLILMQYRILSKIADTLIVRTPQFWIFRLSKRPDSRKIEGFFLSNTRGLKLFDEVLSSQTKPCRVKQGRERVSQGYFNKRCVFPFYNFTENAYLLRACVLSFVDSKAQLRYFGSLNAVVPP